MIENKSQICSSVFLFLGLLLLSISLLNLWQPIKYSQLRQSTQLNQLNQHGSGADPDRIFQVETDGKIIFIDDQPRPVLHLKRSNFYIFRLGKSMKSHPFYISFTDDGGGRLGPIKPDKDGNIIVPKDGNYFPGEYRPGVENNRTTEGDVTIYVTRNTPRTLYYHSATLPYMGNTILSEWDELPTGYIGRVPQWRTYYLLTASQTYNLPMISERKGFI